MTADDQGLWILAPVAYRFQIRLFMLRDSEAHVDCLDVRVLKTLLLQAGLSREASTVPQMAAAENLEQKRAHELKGAGPKYE